MPKSASWYPSTGPPNQGRILKPGKRWKRVSRVGRVRRRAVAGITMGGNPAKSKGLWLFCWPQGDFLRNCSLVALQIVHCDAIMVRIET